jgi:glycosyltransferase involved in cell wall biosynthesis
VVVGEARYDTEYGRAIAREDSAAVRCVGGVYEKNRFNALLKHAYVYIHGHEVGGTNPSLLTALHMGAAPVCMNVIFHRQVVGEEGLFFDAAEGSLAAILRRLDHDGDEVARLRAIARHRSDRLYRWDAVVDAYVSVARLVTRGAKNDAALRDTLSGELYQPERFADRAGHEPGTV